jgi:hypothetical protein
MKQFTFLSKKDLVYNELADVTKENVVEKANDVWPVTSPAFAITLDSAMMH